jgi:hypothetical protein
MAAAALAVGARGGDAESGRVPRVGPLLGTVRVPAAARAVLLRVTGSQGAASMVAEKDGPTLQCILHRAKLLFKLNNNVHSQLKLITSQ